MAETIDIRELNERIERQSAFVTNLTTGMDQVIVGQKHLVESLLIGLLSDGHVLLEGVPGLAKTLAIKTLASLIDAQYSRIQFTPDLLPADVIGTMVYSQKDETFQVKKGPVFANFVLADEINRTSAKTQSALLEAMEEGQVTVDNISRPLPQPFTVIATQNPVGSAGTQLLPESQLDRFMMRLSIGYPSLDQEVLILKQTEGGRPVDSLRQVATLEEVRQMQAETAQVHVAEDLYRYVATLCAATREHPLIRLGASPRAGAALIRACRASAWMAGRDYVIPGDVHLLYYNVLEHRVMPDPQARLSDRTIHDLLAEVMESVPQPKLV